MLSVGVYACVAEWRCFCSSFVVAGVIVLIFAVVVLVVSVAVAGFVVAVVLGAVVPFTVL